MRVDGVGLALAAAGLAAGLLALDDQQAGGVSGAGEPDTVAACALDRDGQPRPGGVVDDPGQQLGEAGGVVADLAGGDRDPVRERDLHLVGVAMGVDPDDGVDEFCQHGHRPGPSCRERVEWSAPVWVGVTEWHICDGSRPRGGQASDQANWWARPVPAATMDKSKRRHAEAARS